MMGDDCFHRSQQFQAMIAARQAQDLAMYNQMRKCLKAEADKDGHDIVLPAHPIPDEVTMELHIHGSELRHMIANAQGFGLSILQKMAKIHDETECQVSFADVGNESSYNNIRAVGPIAKVNGAFEMLVKSVPFHIGIDLSELPNNIESVHLKNFAEEAIKKSSDKNVDLSVHFVNDSNHNRRIKEKYAIFRANREDRDALVDAVHEFTKKVSKPHGNSHFYDRNSFGCLMNIHERPWMLGVPESSLTKYIADRTGTDIRYSTASRNDIHMAVYGSPHGLIEVSNSLRAVAQTTLKFDVNDSDLNKPYDRNVEFNNLLDDALWVLYSIEKSRYQGQEIGTDGIRHTITLRTSFENRHSLFKKRRAMLKRELTKDLPRNEIEEKPEKMQFSEHLHNIIFSFCRPKQRRSHHQWHRN
ncbi:hypothetical protein M3Y95_00207500 [Aphelenchoides besseyi]|nr:hypothetical protein M3Y95_00207500 [Aphelenchoides besseyi]